jgi:hypothetical protein
VLPSGRSSRITALALTALFSLAVLAPVRAYDFFWHLATGRWITEHRALPLCDPFALASERVPWINGEWLFQLLLYAVYAAGGIVLVAIIRAVAVGAIFAFRASSPAGLFLSALALIGGHERLDARASTAGALCLVAALACIRRPLAFIALTIVWINVHPSALLAPLLALSVAIGDLMLREPEASTSPDLTPPRRLSAAASSALLAAASALALLVNPFGIRGVTAPLSLMRLTGSGAFVNAEWLPSPMSLFPLLYATIAIALAVFVTAREPRSHIWRMLTFALLAYLAAAHVRNQGLYFAAFPLLVVPAVRDEAQHRALRWAALVPVAWLLVFTDHSPGADARRFPIAAVNRLEASGLRGNVYNPDQFGGFLIWRFYPQRRVLTDGRNELYRSFIGEVGEARRDGRAWHALLARYRIDLAVDEYRPPLDTVDFETRQHKTVFASQAYWPPREWALIAYDATGMVFARRAAFPPQAIERWELKGVVPEKERSGWRDAR